MQAHELIDENLRLFALPDIAVRVNALIDNPHSSADTIARELELDTALSATLMKVANSAFYGLPGRVDSIAKAVTLVGHKALRDLVISVVMIRSFRGIGEDFIRMVDFWDNSLVCGIVARSLARKCQLEEPDRMFLAGMLHKIGRLVFFAGRLEEYRKVLTRGAQGGNALAEAEREVFGFDYAELGAALLDAWRFPPVLRTAVANQLKSPPQPEYPLECDILYVAADIAEAMSPDIQTGSPTGFDWLEFSPQTLSILGMGRNELDVVMQSSLDQALELIAIVNPRR